MNNYTKDVFNYKNRLNRSLTRLSVRRMPLTGYYKNTVIYRFGLESPSVINQPVNKSHMLVKIIIFVDNVFGQDKKKSPLGDRMCFVAKICKVQIIMDL